jgi:esterase/lipase superfamily enzyme
MAERIADEFLLTMNREYHKWWSSRLGRDMELLVFGHGGMPMLVFPSSMGRFFEYEDAGMIRSIADRFEHGHLQAYCVDSVDGESWYNKRAHPADRVRRHVTYESYVIHEVLPLIRLKNPSRDLAVTGCSFGAYHTLNFTLRHPDLVTHCVCMSGSFDIHSFLDGYYDDECYFNCPVDYLPRLDDPWFLDQYRNRVKFLLAAGDWDICLGANYDMAHRLGSRGIPNWLDVWNGGQKHDWPLWQKMAQKYFT